jgi:hypothetical protein
MNVVSLSAMADTMAPAHGLTALLRKAFEEEARLLESLEEVLHRQREAVALNDLEGVNGSVVDAQRVLLTLSQARRRRQTLMEAVCGDVDASPRDLDLHLGGTLPPDLRAARDELFRSADSVARALRVNDRILAGAVASGRALVKGLGGSVATGNSGLYAPGGLPAPGSAMKSGSVLNRQI